MPPKKISMLKVDLTAEKFLKITGLWKKKTLWMTNQKFCWLKCKNS